MRETSTPTQTAPPTTHSPSLPIQLWGATDVGREREGNEDAVYPHSGADASDFKPQAALLEQKGHLFIVADGVGGAEGGREASHWAIRVAVERYYDMPAADPAANLRAAVEAANTSLYQYLQSVGKVRAGCTMVAAVTLGNTLHVANVGDSRAYLIRDGRINQLTDDHTLTQQKLARGIIQPHEVALDSDSNVLTRSMGANDTVEVDLFSPMRLMKGDTVLLCSDGLTDMLSDQEIAQGAVQGTPRQATGRLIKAANRSGGFDNISVVIARLGRPTAAGAGRGKKLLAGLGALLLIAMFSLLGWKMYGGRQAPAPTAVPTATPAVMLTPDLTVTAATLIEETVIVSPTNTTEAGAATATLRPTPTHTPTPAPRLLRPTATHTPVLVYPPTQLPSEPGTPPQQPTTPPPQQPTTPPPQQPTTPSPTKATVPPPPTSTDPAKH